MGLKDVQRKVDRLRHNIIEIYIKYWHVVGYMSQKKTPDQIAIAKLLKEAHEEIDKLREEVFILTKEE